MHFATNGLFILALGITSTFMDITAMANPVSIEHHLTPRWSLSEKVAKKTEARVREEYIVKAHFFADCEVGSKDVQCCNDGYTDCIKGQKENFTTWMQGSAGKVIMKENCEKGKTKCIEDVNRSTEDAQDSASGALVRSPSQTGSQVSGAERDVRGSDYGGSQIR